jgi:hypothetical protein
MKHAALDAIAGNVLRGEHYVLPASGSGGLPVSAEVLLEALRKVIQSLPLKSGVSALTCR